MIMHEKATDDAVELIESPTAKTLMVGQKDVAHQLWLTSPSKKWR